MMLQATAEDYIATLATMVLLRAGCDHMPVDAKNLLYHAACVTRSGQEVSITKSENGYTVNIPEKVQPARSLCADLLLSILLDAIGRPCRNSQEQKVFQSVFSSHLLCPRPVFKLAHRTWSSMAFLESFFGLQTRFIGVLTSCPSCYVPKELNNRLIDLLRPQYLSLHVADQTNEVSLFRFMDGYEDDSEQLNEPPYLDISRIQGAVDTLIPEHVLTEGHPASLYIEYTEDFEVFSRQFSRLDLAILYASLFEEAPPMPLFGGKPEPGCKAYADRMGRYLSCESSARLAMANAFYQRKYHPSEADILTLSIRKLFELPRR